MRKTLETLQAICRCLHQQMGSHCTTHHIFGEVLGHAAVALAALQFPDGSRYLIQVTKLDVTHSPTD